MLTLANDLHSVNDQTDIFPLYLDNNHNPGYFAAQPAPLITC
jgi:hypothetical protein